MALVPFSYNARSLFVRKSATLLTVLGIAATVAVVAGVLALQQGFERLFTDSGRSDVLVYMRPGATSEGESFFDNEQGQALIKSRPEIALDDSGNPLASMEIFLAVRRAKLDGGETNVPIRGVQPQSFAINADVVKKKEGEFFAPGSNDVIVGSKLSERIRDCRIGDVILFNTTPFRVVGTFDSSGPYASEIWGDVERIREALKRPTYNRVIARLKPGVTAEDLEGIKKALVEHPQTPAKLQTEHEYLAAQTSALGEVLLNIGVFLGVIMGIAAIFTATNTMLAALAARTHEVGILLSIGFRPFPIFLSFLFEALLLGLLGGAVGCLITLPLNGIETGTTNFQTFTEVAFAFRITGQVLLTAVVFSLILGLLGGAVPAWKAARLKPTEALRRA